MKIAQGRVFKSLPTTSRGGGGGGGGSMLTLFNTLLFLDALTLRDFINYIVQHRIF